MTLTRNHHENAPFLCAGHENVASVTLALSPLSLGLLTRVDAADFDRLSEYRWKAVKGKHTYYAARSDGDRIVYMHRQLAGVTDDRQVDHIDRNGLNNRRKNLRIVTPAVNNHNRRAWGASAFKGVTPGRGKWRARIRIDGKLRELGSFGTQEEAAAAYDRAALSHYGEDAVLNAPSPAARHPRRDGVA